MIQRKTRIYLEILLRWMAAEVKHCGTNVTWWYLVVHGLNSISWYHWYIFCLTFWHGTWFDECYVVVNNTRYLTTTTTTTAITTTTNTTHPQTYYSNNLDYADLPIPTQHPQPLTTSIAMLRQAFLNSPGGVRFLTSYWPICHGDVSDDNTY